MDPKTLHEVILPLIVTGVALCALILIGFIVLALRREREGKEVVLNVERLGVTLKGDRVTALVLLFCVMALVPAAVWYVGSQRRLDEAQEAMKKEKTRANTAEEALHRFKFYDLRINPTFREQVDAEKLKDKVQVWITKPGGGASHRRDHTIEIGPAGDLWVYPERLNPGDKLRIVIEAGGQKWASDEIEIPRTQVQMFKK